MLLMRCIEEMQGSLLSTQKVMAPNGKCCPHRGQRARARPHLELERSTFAESIRLAGGTLNGRRHQGTVGSRGVVPGTRSGVARWIGSYASGKRTVAALAVSPPTT